MELVVDVKLHSYGDLVVLQDIDLHLRPGEIVSVIGPSGCGKSTLLGIMGGILKATEGRVLMEGEPAADCLNPLTYIFQDFALLPWRTVAQNVALPLEHHKLPPGERERRVKDALQRTKLDDFANALPKQLSGGMRQRVGIARALVVRPAVLLMDEPLSALDAQTRDLLMEDFLDLWLRERVAGVYVTHNFGEALRLADRIMVLSRRPGRIKEMVAVPIPQRERSRKSAQLELTELGNRLWSLIRDEASSAEREVVDA
ncbi:MAG TPA: ABC transporter ATP-binding protein [Stellaceae bacterium]|nr:ABC transporter ATP-binding protein [Stellaceae bacterium]